MIPEYLWPMQEQILLALAGILLLGMGCQWLAWRVKLPAILFLLTCGFLVGPILGWLHPKALFGDMLSPFITLAVAVILFEGSLTLQFSKIAGLEKIIRNLITIGALITWAITTLATRWIMDLPWELCLVFGAIMVVTGPTVIAPMLRTVRPGKNLARVLRWEGILIDPLGACLAVMAFQFVVAKGYDGSFFSGLLVFGKVLVVGLSLGAIAGYVFGLVLKRYLIPDFLRSVSTLAVVCGVFTLSNMLEGESGLLTVTIMGIWMANSNIPNLGAIHAFKESLSILLISSLFIILPARIDLSGFTVIGWASLGVLAVIQFVARPIAAQICSIGSKLTTGERHLLCWIAPRGIVSAAVISIFASKLTKIGYTQASELVPLTFIIIMGTIVLQSATAGPLARWLGAAEPEPNGFLIIGAQELGRTLAVKLEQMGYRTLLADQDWSAIREAAMRGLATYWGNPVSEHADSNLDLTGLKYLLAISPQHETNLLVMHYYRPEFDPTDIYTIRSQSHSPVEEKNRLKHVGRYLFDGQVTYEDVQAFLRQGASIRTTLLTPEYTFSDYQRQGDHKRLPIFVIDTSGRIAIFSSHSGITPKAGWKILALVQGDTGSVTSAAS